MRSHILAYQLKYSKFVGRVLVNSLFRLLHSALLLVHFVLSWKLRLPGVKNSVCITAGLHFSTRDAQPFMEPTIDSAYTNT